MPIYEWLCKDCKIYYETDEYREAHDGPLCSDCGAVTQRVYTMAYPIFKGSGFYSTDNK